MMLVNDDSVSCRKMATAAIKLLLKKIEAGDRDRLFNVVLKWGAQEKVSCQNLSNFLRIFSIQK